MKGSRGTVRERKNVVNHWSMGALVFGSLKLNGQMASLTEAHSPVKCVCVAERQRYFDLSQKTRWHHRLLSPFQFFQQNTSSIWFHVICVNWVCKNSYLKLLKLRYICL